MTESNLVLGAMYFGTRVTEPMAFALMDRFVARGGRWIDTANCYSFWADASGVGGQSERVIGRWLASRPGMRDRVFISTKVRQQPTIAGAWPESAEGLSKEAVAGAARSSLRRLGVDRIDLYWAHGEDRAVALEETVQAFGDLVDAGIVGRLGASNHAIWRVERARALAAGRGIAGFSALQLRHSYVSPRPWADLPDAGHQLVSSEALDYAIEEGLGLWAYTPLLNGSYSRSDRPLPEVYDHPGTTRRREVLAQIGGETGHTANQIVLAWLIGGRTAVKPIVGVSTLAQLDEALDVEHVDLTPDERERLNAAT